MRTINILACSLPLLAGCASTGEYRTLASSTGVYVENLKLGTNEFIAQQNALNAENANRLDRLAGHRESAAVSARGQAIAWTHAKGAPTLAAYQAATTLSAETIVAQMSSAATRAPALEDAGAADAYGKASEALATLATKPSRLDAFLGLLAYADAVNTAYSDLKDEAKEDAAKTGDASDGVDETVIKP